MLGVRLCDKRLVATNTKEHRGNLNNLITERAASALGPPRAAPREPPPQGPGGHPAPDREYETHHGTQGESIWRLHRTYNGMFNRGTVGGRREGARWFGEKHAWYNRGIRGKKEPSHM